MRKLVLALSLIKNFEKCFILKISQKYWSILQKYILNYSEYLVELL